jgi:hypothetical protein
MDEFKNINIEIDNRTIPVRILEKDEEYWRLAGQKIKERIIFYRRDLKILAPQEVLTMIALEAMSGLLIERAAGQDLKNSVSNRINNLNKIIADNDLID